jgi:hypothetical protein
MSALMHLLRSTSRASTHSRTTTRSLLSLGSLSLSRHTAAFRNAGPGAVCAVYSPASRLFAARLFSDEPELVAFQADPAAIERRRARSERRASNQKSKQPVLPAMARELTNSEISEIMTVWPSPDAREIINDTIAMMNEDLFYMSKAKEQYIDAGMNPNVHLKTIYVIWQM